MVVQPGDDTQAGVRSVALLPRRCYATRREGALHQGASASFRRFARSRSFPGMRFCMADEPGSERSRTDSSRPSPVLTGFLD